jgi:molecular chaperone GrpE
MAMNEDMEPDRDDLEPGDPDEQETVPIQSETTEPPTEGIPLCPEREDLAELRRKAAEYDALMERLKRVTADFMNSQKRLERQADERVAYAVERFAEELLPVADNLARALEAAEADGSNTTLLEGVRLVKKQMLDVFKNHGVEMIETRIGDTFDSNIHEAVAAMPTDRIPPNRVMELHHHGFLLRGRLLRPARVVVSVAPADGKEIS